MATWWELTAMLVGLAAILGSVLLGVCAVLAAVLGTDETEDDGRDRVAECERMAEELNRQV